MSRKDLVHKQNDLKCDPSYSKDLSKRSNFKASLGNLVNLSQKTGAKVMTQWIRALAVLLGNQVWLPILKQRPQQSLTPITRNAHILLAATGTRHAFGT